MGKKKRPSYRMVTARGLLTQSKFKSNPEERVAFLGASQAKFEIHNYLGEALFAPLGRICIFNLQKRSLGGARDGTAYCFAICTAWRPLRVFDCSQYPPSHHPPKKQPFRLFFFTESALLGFKSPRIKRKNHPLGWFFSFGARDGT